MTQKSLAPMAATSDNQDIRGFINKDSLDQRATKPLLDNVPRKKGTFVITSIKMNDDCDSMDDVDESHTERTDGYSSDIFELSCGEETPSALEDMPYWQVPSSQNGGKEKADLHSRFRVVKIDSKEPFQRGRWTCHDSMCTEKSDTKVSQDDANSEGASACSSENFAFDVDDIANSPNACNSVRVQTEEEKLSGLFNGFQPIHPAVTTAGNQPLVLNYSVSQVSSSGYGSISSRNLSQILLGGNTSDVLQSQEQRNPSLCQMVNTSVSFQSINSVNPIDNSAQPVTYIVPSGPQINEICSDVIQNCNQVTNGVIDGNTSNIPPAMLMSHFPTGIENQQQISVSLPSSIHMSVDGNPSIILTQNQVRASSFQTYKHVGDQLIINPVISKSAHVETVHSVADVSVSKTVADHLLMDATVNQAVDEPQCNIDKDADQDKTVMPNSETLTPAVIAAVIDIHEDEKSGSSTVAIDNRIEQAMDLVKSHLMFAVREEVEVLKEQIAELNERNNRLEHENGILRAAANQETLSRLALLCQQPLPSLSSS